MGLFWLLTVYSDYLSTDNLFIAQINLLPERQAVVVQFHHDF